MSTPGTTTTSAAPTRGASPIVSGAAIIVAVAAVVIALSFLRIASSQSKAACVAAQVAKYPAVGVSAFNTKATGPIKVAYDAERRAAVGKC